MELGNEYVMLLVGGRIRCRPVRHISIYFSALRLSLCNTYQKTYQLIPYRIALLGLNIKKSFFNSQKEYSFGQQRLAKYRNAPERRHFTTNKHLSIV